MIPSRWMPERVQWRLFALRLAADPASYARFVANRRRPEGEHVQVRLRQLGGAPVTIRARSADMFTMLDLLPPVHLPPRSLGPVRRAWDLGANIGLTVAHLAVRHPEAHITGVEMDAENAALARRNVAAFGERVRIVEGGVWVEPGEISYVRGDTDEAAFSILDDKGAAAVKADAVLLNGLLEQEPDGALIDYVKMDIEGAEERVLREHTEWAERVRCIRVEVHDPYSVEEALADLERLGFRTSFAPRLCLNGRGKPVQGIRSA